MENRFLKKVLKAVGTRGFVKNLVILFSFVLPILIFYLFYPESFLQTWVGRLQYLIFLWLLLLEFVFSWNAFSLISLRQLRPSRIISAAVFLVIPTIYALAIYFTDLNQLILQIGKFLNVPILGKEINGDLVLQIFWPASFERLILAICFSASVLLLFKKPGVKKLSIALLFLWADTIFNMINAFFPHGTFWILQIFVPFTANSAASVLNFMGHQTLTANISDPFFGLGTIITVLGGQSNFSVLVFWPSAGVHSIIIYALTMLLFIKNAQISSKLKVILFIIGALGTFFVNLLRIATISIIGINVGAIAAQHFHDYYGEFFFISWMVLYLTVILLGPTIVKKLVQIRKTERGENVDLASK